MAAHASRPQQRRALKEATTWFVALQSEQCDAGRRQRFDQWLNEDPENCQAYRDVEQLWGSMDTLKICQPPELKAARSAKPAAWRNGKTVIPVLLASALIGGWWQDYTAPVELYQTGIGQRKTLELADGSRLKLNTASRAQVRISWCRRDVNLQQGEALFTVAHQLWRPFTVQAGNVAIDDIGTVFNVRHTAGTVAVSVLEGEVSLRNNRHRFGESLKAGFSRQSRLDGRWLPAEPANIDQTTAWTQGKLLFNHMPLAAVVAEMERYHPVHFVFADASLSKQTLSGSFDATDLKPFLQALERILPVRVQHQKQNIVLRHGQP